MAKGAKILVVDDEPNTIKTLRRALELEGHVVISAENVADARAALEKGEPDLCLFDVQLPDGDGIELLGQLNEGNDPPPVVMMSGHASIDDAVRALQLGARDFLEKPIGQERLFVTIDNVLALARLEVENQRLREAVGDPGGDEMLGRSPLMKTLQEQIDRVAQSEGRVLITGENGSGKELIARAIHRASRRKDNDFISLNCAAVPADLIESELFGHEKGAFTGAVARKVGKFERAHLGTLFLDEVGDMPASMQAKLLRVLQTGELERVGGTETINVDARVLAATNKDLTEEISAGRFREDLYYRLNVVPLVSPPLRERKTDIPVLVERFLREAAVRNHRPVPTLTERAMALLANHDYPGNVRELKNLVERIIILAPQDRDRLDDNDISAMLPVARRAPAVAYKKGVKLSALVAEAERNIVAAALEEHNGVVAETARSLGIERSNFHKKLKSLGLRR